MRKPGLRLRFQHCFGVGRPARRYGLRGFLRTAAEARVIDARMTTVHDELRSECVELLEEFQECLEKTPTDTCELEAFRLDVVGALEIFVSWAELRSEHTLAAYANQKIDALNAEDEMDAIVNGLRETIAEVERYAAALPTDEDPKETFIPVRFDDPQTAANFITDAYDFQADIDVNLLQLENDPDNMEAFDAAYRALHTLKGTAGFLELAQCQDLARTAESILDLGREKKIAFNARVIDTLLDASAYFKTHIQQIQDAIESGSELGYDEQIPVLVKRLDALADDTAPLLGEVLVEQGAAQQADVDAAVHAQERGQESSLGEILVREEKVEAKAVAQGLRTQKSSRAGVRVESTVRVPTRRVDKLADTVGELTVLESMIQNSAKSKNFDRLVHQLQEMHRIVARLHDLAEVLRSVPIKGLFDTMTRLARDVARKTDKPLNVVVEGQDTELDKSIVDGLSDPMVHLVRNAVDHGLETVEERREAGKDESGTITLRAEQRGGGLLITIRDDGRGLHRPTILKKAVERGLVDADAELTDQDVFRLIFVAGFSTRTEVSDISGRGVGMDVVRKSIEALSGSVHIDSQYGLGSTFTLRFPLNLAVTEGFLVELAGDTYVLPIRNVIRSLRPRRGDVRSVLGQGEFLESEGTVFPVLRLSEMLGLTTPSPEPEDAFLVLVESAQGQAALLVDNLLGQQRVVMRSLTEGLGAGFGLAGAAVMPDGRVGLVFELADIMDARLRDAPSAPPEQRVH